MNVLPQQIANAKTNAPFFAEWLKDVDPALGYLARRARRLPVLRKSTLGEVQKKNPPMGGLITVPMEKVRHVFMSPRGRSSRSTPTSPIISAARAHACGGLPAGRPRLQHLRLSPDAGRHR